LLGLSSGILTTDREGRIGFVNPAGLAILGKSIAIVGQRLDSVSPGLAALTPEQLDRGEIDTELDGRRLVLGLSSVPLYDVAGTGHGHTLIFRDLTSIRDIERERERNDRLATVGRLAANLAHEIRNPLGSLSGSIEMIGQNPDLNEDERRLVDIVQREVGRLNALISEFLEYARPQTPDRSRTDVALLADETVHVFRQDAQATELSIERRGDAHGFADVDPGQVRQILFNSTSQCRAGLTAWRDSGRYGQRSTSELRLSVADGGFWRR